MTKENTSGINLALMMLPDDSKLATASYAERQAALAPKPAPKTRIVVASTNPVKIAATKAAFHKMFAVGMDIVFSSANGFSGVSDQPKSQAETRQGAENRARSVFESFKDTLYTVGIEGGIEDGPDGMRSFAWVAIFDGKQMSCAQTSVFYLPQEVAKLVREGKELGEADDIVFGKSNSKQANGAVGLLTHDAITRADYYEQAVIMACIPFENKSLTWPAPAPLPGGRTKEERDELLAKVKKLLDAMDEPYYAWLAADEDNNEAESKAYQGAAFEALGHAALYFEIYVDADITAPAFAKEKLAEAESVRQNAITAFSDALMQAQASASSPAHSIAHQGHMSTLLAAATMLGIVFPGLVGLPGPSGQISEEDLRTLRIAHAACETDLKMVRGMMNLKNDQAMQLEIDLRKAREEATKYRDMLSEMMLDRNRAQLAAVNAMLDKEELQAQATSKIDGRIKSQKLVDPTDAQIENYRNNPEWERVFEAYSDGKHFLRFECIEPYPQPEAEEDEAQAAAEAAVPEEQPEFMPEGMHKALFGAPEPVISHQIIIGVPEHDEFPITNAILKFGKEAVREAMNQKAIGAGVDAAMSFAQTNPTDLKLAEVLLLAPRGQGADDQDDEF